MTAREEILSAIGARRTRSALPPPPWQQPASSSDSVQHFADRAAAAAAQVIRLASVEEIPVRVADVLRARNMPAIVHLPPDPSLDLIGWDAVPGLTLAREPPGPDDAALAIAPFGIAETGTLVYTASQTRPPSWHFRAGLEIAVIGADSIEPTLENVLAKIALGPRASPPASPKARKGGRDSGGPYELPSTINLVTGPSRTGDIEQTLELGAHGPKELVILIVPLR